MDGIKGPTIYGCNFFMTREAIYGTKKIQKGTVDCLYLHYPLHYVLVYIDIVYLNHNLVGDSVQMLI